MNHKDDNPQGNLTDADVSVAYRTAASETSPAALDRKILREAAREMTSPDSDRKILREAAREMTSPDSDRKILHEAANEVKNTDKARWGNGWLRPAAFVATLGVSIALLLEFSEYQVFAPPNGTEMNGITVAPAGAPNTTVGSSSMSDSSEADDVQRRRTEADTVVPAQSSFERAEADSVQPGSATAPAPPQSRADPTPLNHGNADTDAFKEAANATAKQVREVDASADATLQEMPETKPAAEPTAGSAIPALGAVALDIAVERQQCTDNQRINAEEWWLCIGKLRNAGHQDEAELELQQLQDAYPQFSPQQ